MDLKINLISASNLTRMTAIKESKFKSFCEIFKDKMDVLGLIIIDRNKKFLLTVANSLNIMELFQHDKSYRKNYDLWQVLVIEKLRLKIGSYQSFQKLESI